MEIVSVSPLASPSVLKTPLFSVYRGEEVLGNGGDVSLYLPTQILSLTDTDRIIVAPGAISVRLDGGRAVITDAAGGVKEILRNAITDALYVPIGLIRKDSVITARAGGLEDEMSIASFFIRRAIAYAEEVSTETREIEALKSRATTTVRELLEGKVGIAFIYFTTRAKKALDKRTNEMVDTTAYAWTDSKTKKDYSRIGVLVERSASGEFSIVGWIKENEDLIHEGCKTPKQPGEDFCGLDYPLAGFLRKLQRMFSLAKKSAVVKSKVVVFEMDFAREMLVGAGEVFEAKDWKFSTDDSQSIYVNAVIANEESGSLLYVYKYDDGKESWGSAGGGAEPGETKEEALFREVEAESGFRIYRGCINGKLVGVKMIVERQVNPRHRRITFYSTLNNRTFTPSMRGVKERNEIRAVKLFSLDEFLKMPHFPWDRSTADPNVIAKFGYRKQLHTDDTISTLSLTGKLGRFGFREATKEDVIAHAMTV